MVQLTFNKSVIPFKNRKRIFRGHLVTEPKVKQHMEEMADGFLSQLRSVLETGDAATWTDAQRRSWIHSNLPADDCWTCIPHLELRGSMDKSNIGCTILITPCLWS